MARTEQSGGDVLLIDDDTDIQLLLSRFLSKKGFAVETAGKGSTALDLFKKKRFDLVLCDHRLPDTDSLELLTQMRLVHQDVPVIVITGYSDVRIAVELMRRGAFDYVVKPLYPDEILMRIEEALAAGLQKAADRAHDKDATPTRSRAGALPESFVQAPSVASQRVLKHIELVAPTDITVLISGETGTGKEYVARAIHTRSKRASAPFVAVDCGALPKELAGSELFGHVKGSFTGAIADKRGSFEQAQGGTLFLDEIGNLTYENQVKLLRVLQERSIRRIGSEKTVQVDVRVIAATNADLKKEVAEGRFREDLFHRINEFPMELMPLRERREDVEVFAHHFLGLACKQLEKRVEGFDENVLQHILSHGWQGNLRELGNVVKRAVLMADGPSITMACLPPGFLTDTPIPVGAATTGSGSDLRHAADMAERQAILNALERTGYNKSHAAELLKIDRKTLYNKVKALGIELERPRAAMSTGVEQQGADEA